MGVVQLILSAVSVIATATIAALSIVFNSKIAKQAQSVSQQSMAFEAKRSAYTKFMESTYGILKAPEDWERAAVSTYGLMLYAPDEICAKANRHLMIIDAIASHLDELLAQNKDVMSDVVYQGYHQEYSDMALEITKLLNADIRPK